VDANDLKIYGCDTDGNIIYENGILLTDLNDGWFRLLDREDREYLSNLFNNKN
jgi:hypothetical protein